MSVARCADLRDFFRIEASATVGPKQALRSTLCPMADSPMTLSRAGLVGLESHLLERVDAAVMAVDLQGRILFANRYAETLYGWSPEETIGRLASEVSGIAIEPHVAVEIMEALDKGGSWEGTFEVRSKDGSLLSVHAVNSPLYDSKGQLSGIVSLAIDATRERVERFLADCSEVLGASLDYADNLASLAALTVPFLGDICFIDIAEDNGLRRVAAAHADPDKQSLIDELGHRYPPDPDGSHPALEALRSGATFYLEDITDDVVRRLSRDDNHYLIVRELGFRSFMVVPLIARGRTLGAVTIISCNPERRFGPADVEVLGEAARRAAIALDNARLFDDQQRARAEAESSAERLLQLQTLATALSRAVTVDEVTKVMGAIAMPQLGSHNRGLWLVNEAAGTVDLVNDGSSSIGKETDTSISLDSALPAAEVVRIRTPVLVGSIAEREERFPDLELGADDGRAFAALPLIAEERTLGVFALAFDDDHDFDDNEIRFLTAVADQCAQALARALLYDRERHERDRAERDRRRIQALNKALQTSLLPPVLPLVPGVELEARYQPALAGLEVGGDFYDVFDTGGDWAIVIGDVCGKGPEAAAVTAVARWTIRSIAMDIRQPIQVLRKVNEALVHQQLDDRFCTIAYARVVPTSQGVRVSMCRGGHPAPLIVRASGEITPFGTAGSLIGILPEVRLWEETTELHTNDALVLYTDGVTEARRGRDQFGDERLRETLEACHGQSAAHIADAIEAAVLEFAGPEPSDDIAILVLRVT
jgi:PAS domain S-box-containing protein